MRAQFLFLGTGGSVGIPILTCKCPVCSSLSLYNKRSRPSALIIVGDQRFLIDVGPDFRYQALLHGIDDLTGVLLTHSHYDHISGIDELRVFYFKHMAPLPLLGSKETLDEIRHRFHYLFDEKGAKLLDIRQLQGDFGTVNFEGLKIDYVSYFQTNMKVTGYRFGKLAYITDIREYSPQLIAELIGVEILIVSALRHLPTDAHFTVDDAINFSKKVGAKQTFMTHINHDLEHDETNRNLPKGFSLAYDGLEIEFDYEKR